jgi:multiple sugar transport system substrate-binding protein
MKHMSYIIKAFKLDKPYKTLGGTFMKKIALILVIVLAAGLFAACAQDPQSGNQGAASGDRSPVTLRMTWWGSQNRHDRTIEAAELFMEINPWVTIEPEFYSWADYWTALATQIAGNNLCDVFQQDHQFIVQYARDGTMYDLTPFIGNGIDVTYIDDNSIQGGAVDGKVYAISLGLNSQGVVYDPALFDSAGIAHPGERWSWDEYKDTIRQLNSALGIFGD